MLRSVGQHFNIRNRKSTHKATLPQYEIIQTRENAGLAKKIKELFL